MLIITPTHLHTHTLACTHIHLHTFTHLLTMHGIRANDRRELYERMILQNNLSHTFTYHTNSIINFQQNYMLLRWAHWIHIRFIVCMSCNFENHQLVLSCMVYRTKVARARKYYMPHLLCAMQPPTQPPPRKLSKCAVSVSSITHTRECFSFKSAQLWAYAYLTKRIQ